MKMNRLFFMLVVKIVRQPLGGGKALVLMEIIKVHIKNV